MAIPRIAVADDGGRAVDFDRLQLRHEDEHIAINAQGNLRGGYAYLEFDATGEIRFYELRRKDVNFRRFTDWVGAKFGYSGYKIGYSALKC